MKRPSTTTMLVLCILVTLLATATRNSAQGQAEKVYQSRGLEQWAGTAEQAVSASVSGATIPLATFSWNPTKVKEKKALVETIVGTNPFSTPLTGTSINAVIIPMAFNIGGVVFDPTAPNSCDNNYSVVDRFNLSPLVLPVTNLTFNGVNVGNVQYSDGFMRAEFWNVIGGNPAYSNPIIWSTAAKVTITAGANGITYGTGCNMMGIVSQAFLNTQIAAALKAGTQSGVISPTRLVVFLTENVVGSSASPPTPPGTSTCCNYGYHTVTGNPPQFYIFADYADTNIGIVSHEIAEFMNDPLLNNPTPSWGEIGSIPGCSSVLEVGDPLTTIRVSIPMNGFTYTPSELAYFSWFFNSPTTASLGAGGVFSSNASFLGPSKACPPGGTY